MLKYWKYSKRCNVERECAKQYSRDILYQVPYDTRKDVKLYEEIESVRLVFNIVSRSRCESYLYSLCNDSFIEAFNAFLIIVSSLVHETQIANIANTKHKEYFFIRAKL